MILTLPALLPCASAWGGLNLLPCPWSPSAAHYPEEQCRSSAHERMAPFPGCPCCWEHCKGPHPLDPGLSLLTGMCCQQGQSKMFILKWQIVHILSGAAWTFCLAEQHHLGARVAARDQSFNAYFSCKTFFSICTALWLSECYSIYFWLELRKDICMYIVSVMLNEMGLPM